MRYTLSEPARVTFAVEQAASGRRKGYARVKPTRRLRRARRCVLLRVKGTLTRAGVSGPNDVGFSGWLSSRRLARGSYRLVVQAIDAAANRSAIKTVLFTIVRR